MPHARKETHDPVAAPSEGHVPDGIRDAVMELYDNGQVKFRGAHLDGEMHGEWVFYRRDGSLMRAGSFEHGRRVGTWRTYDRAGLVVRETEFRPG